MRGIPAALALVPLLAMACGSSPPAGTPGVVDVVAGENFWGSVVGQIGGSHVRVTSIVSDPNTDPHLYESSAVDAAAVAQARLVIENGAGYDDFLSRLLDAAGGSNRSVLNVQYVLGMRGSDVNPHFWYDIPRVPDVGRALAAALGKIDPGDSSTFQANLARFDASLRPIQAVLGQIRSRHSGAPVAYTERVPEYLLLAGGLGVRTPAGFASAIEEGNDPSPAGTLAMNQLISSRGIDVLLYNAQTVSAITQNVRKLAQQAGVPVVAVTETLPPSFQTYQQWQLAQAQSLLHALGG